MFGPKKSALDAIRAQQEKAEKERAASKKLLDEKLREIKFSEPKKTAVVSKTSSSILAPTRSSFHKINIPQNNQATLAQNYPVQAQRKLSSHQTGTNDRVPDFRQSKEYSRPLKLAEEFEAVNNFRPKPSLQRLSTSQSNLHLPTFSGVLRSKSLKYDREEFRATQTAEQVRQQELATRKSTGGIPSKPTIEEGPLPMQAYKASLEVNTQKRQQAALLKENPNLARATTQESKRTSANPQADEKKSIKEFAQVLLKPFPKNGLKYSGKINASTFADDETLYKKDLTRILNDEANISQEQFSQFLEFNLCGIFDLLKNPAALPPSLPQDNAKKPSPSLRNNLEFIKSLIPSVEKSTSELFSRKVTSFLRAVELTNDREELDKELARAGEKNPAIIRLLSGFLNEQNNNAKITSAPFIFFRYALQAELTLISKQISVLENHVAVRNTPERNVGLLERTTDHGLVQKDMMLSAIEGKRSNVGKSSKSPGVLEAYKKNLEHPIKAAKLQFSKLRSGGVMDIASKNPATRPFESQYEIPLIAEDQIISEEQYAALLSIEEAIAKSSRVNPEDGTKIGGHARMRMRTGGGKTHVINLMDQFFERNRKEADLGKNIINLDLNSSNQTLDLLDAEDLSDTIIQADEGFFYGILGTNISKRINPEGKTNPNEIIKLQNNFLYNLRKKGATLITIGASESLEKIQNECDRLREKIKIESIDQTQHTYKEFIKQAQILLYGVNGKIINNQEPVFPLVISGNLSTNEANNKAHYNKGSRNIPLQKLRIKASGKEEKNTGIKFTVPDNKMTHKEFLIVTAWSLKWLYHHSEIGHFYSDIHQGAEKIFNALIPKSIGLRSKNSKNNKTPGFVDYTTPEKKDEELVELLQLSQAVKTKTTFKDYYIALSPLNDAVKSFLEKGFHKSLRSSSAPSNKSETKLQRLTEKLEFRDLQYEDLKNRRDNSTLERLKETQLHVMPASAQTSLEEMVKESLSANPLQPSERMQYILPDFEIKIDPSTRDQSTNYLSRILELSKADTLIFPFPKSKRSHNKEPRFLLAASDEDDSLFYHIGFISELSRPSEASDIALFLTGQNSIISFFDQTNSIGGDYGIASTNISRQYIQPTKDGCLQGLHALDRNYLMQFNRDRTDPDEAIDNIDLKLILPQRALENAHITCDESHKMPKELISLIEVNTLISDRFHLDGYKSSKIERKPTSYDMEVQPTLDELAYGEPITETAPHALSPSKVSSSSPVRITPSKPREHLVLLKSKYPKPTLFHLLNFDKVETSSEEETSDPIATNEEAFIEDPALLLKPIDQEKVIITASERQESDNAANLLQLKLSDSKLFLSESHSSNLLQLTEQTLRASDFTSADFVEYILPDFDLNQSSYTPNDLAQILSISKANALVIPYQENSELKYAFFDRNPEGEGLSQVSLDSNKLNYFLEGYTKTIPDQIIIRFFDKNSLTDEVAKDELMVSRQYIQLTNNECLDHLDIETLSQYDRRSPTVDFYTSGSMDLKLIIPRAAFNSAKDLEGNSFEELTDHRIPDGLIARINNLSAHLEAEAARISDNDHESLFGDNEEVIYEGEIPPASPTKSSARKVTAALTPKPKLNYLSYKSELAKDSYWLKGEANVNDKFKVLKEVYQNSTKDVMTDISDTIFSIIIQSALSCSPKLTTKETLRALEIARVTGSITQSFKNKERLISDGVLIDDDLPNQQRFETFSGNFQKNCEKCGIFLYDLSGAMRSANIPYIVGERITAIPQEKSLELYKKKTLEILDRKKSLTEATIATAKSDAIKSVSDTIKSVI